LIRNLGKIDPADVLREDRATDADDVVAHLSSELLTFKQEALEADPAYFRAGLLESASGRYDEADADDEEALGLLADDGDEEDRDEEDREEDRDEEDYEEDWDEEDEDAEAEDPEIAGVVREDRARGRTRRIVTRTILPADHGAMELALGSLEKEDLGFPAILLGEASAFLGADGFDSGPLALALKAKLTCAGSLLARGRRFKTARRVEELVRQATLLIGNGQCDGDGWRDEIRHKIAEGRAVLRSFLSPPL